MTQQMNSQTESIIDAATELKIQTLISEQNNNSNSDINNLQKLLKNIRKMLQNNQLSSSKQLQESIQLNTYVLDTITNISNLPHNKKIRQLRVS